jgi:Dyp-type peroxidase family
MATQTLKKLTPEELKNIQGIIISGYGHLPNCEYQFLTIGDTKLAKNWLDTILPKITIAHRPDDGTGKKKKPGCALNIAFTYAGITKFGTAAITNFSQEFVEGIAEPHRTRRLGDDGGSAPELWDIKEPDVHILLMIQAPNMKEREIFSNERKSEYAQYKINLVRSEYGNQPANSKEHFGFLDSVSQPFIEHSPATPKGTQSCVKAGEFILGYHNEYELLPATPTIKAADDKNGYLPTLSTDNSLKDFGCNGSYFVFRKLYQDVAAFNRYLDENTKDEKQKALVGAKFVGRWASGTPLVNAPDADIPNPNAKDNNDFFFMNNDAKGLSCPIGSHIRRSNPRDSLAGDQMQSIQTVNRHRLLRRGIQYGPQFPGGNLDDGQDRGILFFCVNADIKRQFEFVQQTWINNPKFGDMYNDRDPITGNNFEPAGDNDGKEYNMTIPSCLRERFTGIPRFVQVKGGAYFFLPAIPALKYLAAE